MILQCPYCNMNTAGEHEYDCPNRKTTIAANTLLTEYQRGYADGYKAGKKDENQILKNVVRMYEDD